MINRPLSCLLALTLLSLGIARAEGQGGIPVTTVEVSLADLREIVPVRARIESVNAPTLYGKVAAEVVEIRVDEGDRVRKGQVLARLDDEAFRLDREAARADIARLEATLANQRLTLKRDEALFRKGLIPDTQLDASRTAVKQTQASIVHARALLKKAEYQLSHTVIESPIDGVVQRRLASVGDYLNPMSPASKPLFQIVDTHHLRARLLFPEDLSDRLRPGLPLVLRYGDARVSARIGELLPMIDEGSLARIALADFENVHDWPPGLHLTAEVVLAVRKGVPVLPEAALVRRPAGLVVYRLREDGRTVEQVAVRTGIREGDRVEILEGPRAGDVVALDGAPYLTDGAEVMVREETPVQ